MLIDTDETLDAPPPATRRRPRRRLIWSGLLLIVLAAAGLFAWREWQAAAAPEIRTVAVVRGDIERTVTALGALQPKDYVDVGAQVSGQLKQVHVEIGDRVEKGALLAEIDPTVFETRVRTNKANLENLKAQLDQQQAELALSRKQLKRNQALFKAKAISQDTLETSETQVEVGEARSAALAAQIDAAQATYDGDVANLGYTKIYAPMSGTIVSQTALEGQTLNANQSAPVIVRIADLQTMTVKAQVAEADVVRIKTGMPVYFTTLGLPDRRWQATVRQVLPTPEIVNDVVLYNVLIDVGNDDGVLMTDMTAQVFFVLGRAADVPLVPVAALGSRRADSADEYQVRVLEDGRMNRRVVKVGLTDRASAEVVSGLEVGDRVILDAAASAESAGGRAGARVGGLGFRL
ncbi:MAG: macrolide transporter subunit MacA [Dongiaceae bacterium]